MTSAYLPILSSVQECHCVGPAERVLEALKVQRINLAMIQFFDKPVFEAIIKISERRVTHGKVDEQVLGL